MDALHLLGMFGAETEILRIIAALETIAPTTTRAGATHVAGIATKTSAAHGASLQMFALQIAIHIVTVSTHVAMFASQRDDAGFGVRSEEFETEG